MAKCGNNKIFSDLSIYVINKSLRLYFTLENIFIYKYYYILEQITKHISFETEFMWSSAHYTNMRLTV